MRGATEALINSYSADDPPAAGGGTTTNSTTGPPPSPRFSVEISGGVYNPPELLEMLKRPENCTCADCGAAGILPSSLPPSFL